MHVAKVPHGLWVFGNPRKPTELKLKRVRIVPKAKRIKRNMDEVKTEVVADVIPAVEPEKDELTIAREKLAKAEEDRDNYKAVALKRLGKLPGDAEFLDKDGNGELSVAEQVRLTLLEREVEESRKAEKEVTTKLAKENAELRLALKNRPGASIGGGSGESVEVKDNVFSAEQIAVLKQKALRLNADPDKFIENAKQNLLKRR